MAAPRVLAVAGAAAFLAACGTASGTVFAHVPPLEAVRSALLVTAHAGTAHAALVDTGPHRVATTSASGTLDWRDDSYDFVTVNHATGPSGTEERFEQRRVDGLVYARPVVTVLGQQSSWHMLPSTFDAHKVGAAIAAPLTNPLEVLGGARPPASDLGTQTVGGVSTEHYRVNVCVPPSLHGDVPPDVSNADIWVDTAGRIRRVRTAILMAVGPPPDMLTSVLTLSDYGTAFSTTVPSVQSSGGIEGGATGTNGC